MITKYITAFFLLISAYGSHAQGGTWTAINGSGVPNDKGSYGVMGIPSASNLPPARELPGYWTDTAGNFWIYGGDFFGDIGIVHFYCDLWKFDPVSLMWTWVNGCNDNDSVVREHNPVINTAKGIYDANNSPGSTGSMFTWTTHNNHLWFFGGDGSGGNILWQYDPAINEWAYMALMAHLLTMGHSMFPIAPMPLGNVFLPGTSWVDDSDNLWLFGGSVGGATAVRNDLWKYDVSNGIWTWVNGSSLLGNHGSYGTMGVASSINYPYSRSTFFAWKDDSGNFWLSGGINNQGFFIQDVWKFNPSTLEWTWVSGSGIPNDSAPQGAVCDSSYTNEEGGRWANNATWKICDDLIINYGGMSQTGVFPLYIDDIWGYVPSIGEWIKLANGPTSGQPHPSAKAEEASFVDKNGGLWMFGGQDANSANCYNDLWKYTIDSTCVPVHVCNITTGISEVADEFSAIKVYPNPGTDYLTIDYVIADWNKVPLSLEVWNVLGQKIFEQALPLNTSVQKMDISNFAAGIYAVCIKNNGRATITNKIIKQ